ncbi:MAG: glycosyltransferase family 4 protein [Cyclobacteriaceae bacterium]|nr:glycosyltransferase family 4 protein [Cyclobacteriaceae bacterium]
MARETIVFLSSKNPTSITDWSGIPYFMYQTLCKHYQVIYLASPELKYAKLMGYYFNIVINKLVGKKYLFDYGVILSCICGLINTLALRKVKNARFVFCPAGLSEVAFLKTKIPIVTCGDCSMLQLIDYYPSLQHVLIISKWEIAWIERRALKKATFNFFSSRWTTDFILDQYRIRNTCSIPFGANLTNPPTTLPLKELPSNECTILFVGVDWIRKGGDFALKIRAAIQHLGLNCKLVIIGSSPGQSELSDEGIEVYRKIDKIVDRAMYEQKFKEAHFMILPTLADCTPIVISEAFAFGLPVVAADTGGISTMIEDGVNGFLLQERVPMDHAKVIVETFKNPERYHAMSEASFKSFKTTFNWGNWMDKVNDQVKQKLEA